MEYKGYIVKIEQDECPINPREWDNLGVMVCNHRRYDLGDETLECNGVSFEDDLKKHLEGEGLALKEVIVLPLYLYDHSGITMNIDGFSCPRDSGQVGFIYVSKKRVREEYGVKRISKELKERVIGILKAEVEVYSQYLEGDVWGYSIEDCEGNFIDSCYGFYGYESAESEAKAFIDGICKKVA